MRGRAGSSRLPGLRERGLWLRNRGFAVNPPDPTAGCQAERGSRALLPPPKTLFQLK